MGGSLEFFQISTIFFRIFPNFGISFFFGEGVVRLPLQYRDTTPPNIATCWGYTVGDMTEFGANPQKGSHNRGNPAWSDRRSKPVSLNSKLLAGGVYKHPGYFQVSRL